MKWTILAVGKIKDPFTDDVAHFTKLLSGQARVEIHELREDDQVARRIPERAFVCLLDERGRSMPSADFARWVEDRRQGGRDVCFVIGGPFGIALDRADERLALGPMTLPYQLARVVLLEQLYRAHKIIAGEPYHH